MQIRLFATSLETTTAFSTEVTIHVRPNQNDLIVVHDEMFFAKQVLLDGESIFVDTSGRRPEQLLMSLGFVPSDNVFDFKSRTGE